MFKSTHARDVESGGQGLIVADLATRQIGRAPASFRQYASEQFQRLMADHDVVCSMSQSVWDNTAMESFSLR